ncbi:PP2C family protein-serine/threonine phosphatase [Streptomyces sp. NPDC058052]|uniref:PP2C family protein-serine/threonine phosphatase n=1 Tax=Streptomyces sp. NPDC058052 TaxID=3346316 RepID=UPI0036E664FC
MGSGEKLLSELIARSRPVLGRDLAALVSETGRDRGLHDVRMYLADLQQAKLVALPLPTTAGEETLSIDDSAAGQAYRRERTVRSDDGATLWVPMIDGVERLGVLKATAAGLDDELISWCEALAGVAALLLVSKSSHNDLLIEAERRRAMTVQGELVWAFLPPRTIGSARVTSSAVLEPAYDIGGDAFDHSFDGDALHLALLDSMGHDLASGGASAAGLAACRATRRSGGSLADIVLAIDRILDTWFTDRLMTAVIARLDTADGTLAWVNCAHPPPLLIRDNRILPDALVRESDLPLGWGFHTETPPAVHTTRLEPGDRVLLYSDGVTEARSPQGDLFGEERLSDTVIRALGAGDPAPEALRLLLRDLLRHQDRRLRDDATIVLAEWHPNRGSM